MSYPVYHYTDYSPDRKDPEKGDRIREFKTN